MVARWIGLYAVFVSIVVVSLFVGVANLSVSEVWNGLLSGIGLDGGARLTDGIVLNIRLPRVIGGVLIGVALGVAAVGLQAVYTTRLAEPYLLGISSAGGLGFLIGALFGSVGGAPVYPLVLAALAGSLLALATRRMAAIADIGQGMILLGVALNFVFLAWTLMLTYALQSPRLPTFVYFVFGSLGTVTWPVVWLALPLVAITTIVIGRLSRSLDLLAIGHDEAISLGVDVNRVSVFVLTATGVATGASVAVAGVVGFVGLLAPLIARRFVGPFHRHLLHASAVVGAVFVLGSDILIRGIGGNVEVPLGVVTAAIGGPLLVVMLLKKRVL